MGLSSCLRYCKTRVENVDGEDETIAGDAASLYALASRPQQDRSHRFLCTDHWQGARSHLLPRIPKYLIQKTGHDPSDRM